MDIVDDLDDAIEAGIQLHHKDSNRSRQGYVVHSRNPDNPQAGDPNNQRFIHMGPATRAQLAVSNIPSLDGYLQALEEVDRKCDQRFVRFVQDRFEDHDADTILATVFPKNGSLYNSILRVVLFEGNETGNTIEPHRDMGLYTFAVGESGPGLIIDNEVVNRREGTVICFAGLLLPLWVEECEDAHPEVFNDTPALHSSEMLDKKPFTERFARYAVVKFFDPDLSYDYSGLGYTAAYGTEYNVSTLEDQD